MYSKPMVQQQNNSQVVKMATYTAIALLSTIAAIQVVNAQELINTATNEIAQPVNIVERDVLEELYTVMDAEATETQSTFILVENEDHSVELYRIAYPYEDYAETDLPMVQIKGYANIEGAAGQYNGIVEVLEQMRSWN